jgi:hypothetical protein
VPCVIEADVPIVSLPLNGGLTSKVIRRYLVHRGYRTEEPLEHEDRIKMPLCGSSSSLTQTFWNLRGVPIGKSRFRLRQRNRPFVPATNS